MKTNGFTVILGALFLLSHNAMAQTQSALSISKVSPTNVQVNWVSVMGLGYRLLATPSLDSPIVWSPFEDIYATNTNTSVVMPTTASKTGFLRLQTLDGKFIVVPLGGLLDGVLVPGYMQLYTNNSAPGGVYVGTGSDGAVRSFVMTSNLTGIADISSGGTGATNASMALSNLTLGRISLGTNSDLVAPSPARSRAMPAARPICRRPTLSG